MDIIQSTSFLLKRHVYDRQHPRHRDPRGPNSLSDTRGAAVASIVSDSKLVSLTSRHLGAGPTQHDTFVCPLHRELTPSPPNLPTYLSLPLARLGSRPMRGHASLPCNDWPDPIHVAIATFLRPSPYIRRPACVGLIIPTRRRSTRSPTLRLASSLPSFSPSLAITHAPTLLLSRFIARVGGNKKESSSGITGG